MKAEGKGLEFAFNRTLMEIGVKDFILDKVRNHTTRGFSNNPFTKPLLLTAGPALGFVWPHSVLHSISRALILEINAIMVLPS